MESAISDYEYRMSLAVEDARNIGLRASARKHGFSPSSLKDRCDGGQDIRTAHQKEMSLTVQQEKDLVSYILDKEKAFQPLTKREIHDFAESLASVYGGICYLGKNWVDRFVARHTDIEMKLSRVRDYARKRCVTKKSLTEYYDGLNWVINNKRIPRQHTYNVDEAGVQLGETNGGIVAGTVLTPVSERIKSGNSTWSSIIEAASADGQRLKPCIIFTGENLQGQWFPEAFSDWKYTTRPSGWSNADIFMKWLMEVFIPETEPPDSSQWRLLVMDQHKSHITAELMKKAWLHKIWLSWLPSHSSHITQPLDVAVFSPLKTYYRQETRFWASYEATSPNQQRMFIQAYGRASNKTLNRRNIISGFSSSEICPLKVEKAIEALKPKEKKRKGFEGPTTPRKSRVFSDDIWRTPQGSHDLQQQLEASQMDGIPSIRDFNCMMRKAMKCIDEKNSHIQRLEEEKAVLIASAAAKQPTGRVPVQFDPNQTFRHIEQIITARDRAEMNVLKSVEGNKQKRRKRNPPKTQSADSTFLEQYPKSQSN
jgi:4-hydroxybenzoate polyprenyltransferase